ncbi:glutamate synthase large subunit [Planococcus lenghuensis]|uniref:Glutamate synthase large subunit n=1 Tax=Planococcus lenghuensis TaxID=2213202 RepID=A0A1Q2KY00_9BACL|nr:glutamate synthase large subunit [Planococcus lenghuensis]AQQ53069.1 glutamate synthase large subunit [Planococcus lenghuensis]
MNKREYPVRQGLYDPEHEHEACGIGMIASVNGEQSHEIVQNAINILCNLEHRGGQSADTSTGDGAGILTQIPHRFFKKQCEKEGIVLPDAGRYGIGMVFMPQDYNLRMETKEIVQRIIEEEGQECLGWRPVPLNDSFVGQVARGTRPVIRQVFVKAADGLMDPTDLERKLYVIRKRIENEVAGREAFRDVYFCSLSAMTIVYKGMLIPEQLDSFYIDLNHPEFKSALALVHSRFSTNTFPSWQRSHPNRYSIHNGEFNTLRGNVNWMRARQALSSSPHFSREDLDKLLPVIDESGSDSSMFDNCFEFLHLSGRSLAHTAMMMVPEPWVNDPLIKQEKRDFYEYHSTLMEPWDGPAALVMTNGRQIVACLDRNGLRPARYYVTKSGMIVLGSEVGALDIFSDDIIYKERLHPGKMLLIDLEEGKIVPDEEIKMQVATELPYKDWIASHMMDLEDLPAAEDASAPIDSEELLDQHLAFGYTMEEVQQIVRPLAWDKKDPVGSMGYDSPLAVLSHKPQLLYSYFKQLFAQVTNPPIDAIREQIVTATRTTIGREGNLVEPSMESCRHIRLETPILTNEQLETLRSHPVDDFKAITLPILFRANGGAEAMEQALEALFARADRAYKDGAVLLVLSDRGVNKKYAAIPALLAVSGLHHHLIRKGTRTKVSILLESAEPREVHHFAALIGYGAEGINPYLALRTVEELVKNGDLPGEDETEAKESYIQASTDGIVKVLSKMGISTVQSYRGAQIFEAVGIHQDVIDKYFTRTSSRIGGIGLDIIAAEVLARHEEAFPERPRVRQALKSGDEYQYRANGDSHSYNPMTIHTLQQACRTDNFETFKKYSRLLTDEKANLQSLRGLLAFKQRQPVPIEEVEPIEAITARFKTGAMSYGSISEEAHEALAIAMNRIGGKSNSGEGGENSARFEPDENGDSRRSAIKQVASGRFGVTSHYLVNADEIQIKVAQGAKPGEGGHLPGKKVYPWIAEVRGSTPGVELISPPPHHDIYSIEDLAELIFNLKNANPKARISVKLVSAVGVGTIATGVAKGRADLVLISGYDGGTGAAPKTSLKNTGLPWEIGLAETHQTLMLNGLRDRIVVETDGKMMTGRDVVVASLLGAEEFGFATAPLVVLGCVMMRVCHLDTCPVGIATQNPELRKKYGGDPEHVVNFMRFIAMEVRELMAELGFRTVDEMIGRTDVLEVNEAVDHWKTKGLDLSALLYQPELPPSVGRHAMIQQDHNLEQTLDYQELLPRCENAIETGEPVEVMYAIRNIHRAAGSMIGSAISRKYGAEGLPEDTIKLNFAGSAGQSFGAFIPKGMTMRLTGDSNDFVGKGLSGGKIIVHPASDSTFIPEKNIIIGNVSFYGASAGEAYIYGLAGERFAVRNSGADVVVEGIGDHGCEYMTGGRVVVLGPTGKNFAAGMSGGVAYVLDEFDTFSNYCNQELVHLQPLADPAEIAGLKEMIEKHADYTGSNNAKRILEHWEIFTTKFVRVIPKAYLEINERISTLQKGGMDKSAAEMIAFEESKLAKAGK